MGAKFIGCQYIPVSMAPSHMFHKRRLFGNDQLILQEGSGYKKRRVSPWLNNFLLFFRGGWGGGGSAKIPKCFGLGSHQNTGIFFVGLLSHLKKKVGSFSLHARNNLGLIKIPPPPPPHYQLIAALLSLIKY